MPWFALAALLILSFPVFAADLGPNLAFRKPVEASGEVWSTLSSVSLTDGDPNTFCHPLASTGTRGFYFEVDLGATFRLEEIRVRNRGDGCCPERLTRYRVEVYSDEGGEPGGLAWGAEIRADGSHSGVSGVDVIKASAHPAGNFAGRFVRVVNASGLAYSPQLAEIEVYGGKPPTILRLEAERDSFSAGEGTILNWEAKDGLGGILQPGNISVTAAGSIRVEPRETTRYTLTMTNDAGAVSASILIGVNVTLAPPAITEFLADNGSGLKDEDRDESDWIELQNTNLFSVNLNDYFLSDDPANPMKWRFPARYLRPGARLIVFASGKDRKTGDGELHTNFRLDAGGEYLALAGSGGTVIQQFPADYPLAWRFPAQTKNVSYGRGTNGVTGFMRPPTPNAANGQAFAGAVSDTKFNPDRGFYRSNIVVTIQTDTPGATIRYTTNGSVPTAASGTIYTSPIAIAGTTVLRAAAFRPGWSPTDVDTHSYIFPSNVVASPNMRTIITRSTLYAPHIVQGLLDIPSISLTTPHTIDGTAEVRTSMEWLPADGGPGVQEDCGVRHFGGAFTTFAKKNFRLYFRSAYGAPELRAPLFERWGGGIAPVEEFDQLELRGGSHDMEQRGFYMSNIHADDTLLELKQLNPHGRFVHLYLNGVYWGVYHLRERWGAAMHQSYLGGSRTNYESINGNWNVGGWAEPGTPYDGDGSAWERVKNLRNNFLAVKPFLDVEQYIDFMIVWMFGGSEDEYRAVGPAGQGSGFKFYLNDADGWFCGPWYCAAGNRTARGSPGRANGDGPGSIFSMLFRQAHPEYRMLLADRIHHALFNRGALTPVENIARLNARASEIERAFIAEAARWNYLTPAQWQSRRDYALTNWLPRRTAEVISDFRAAGLYPSVPAPVFSRPAGRIAPSSEIQMTTARGVAFHTLDGSDPRFPGGAVSPSARTGSVRPAQNTLVRTRARDGGVWSALNEAFFETDEETIRPGELAISEIHLDSPRGGGEYLELMNVSERALDLDGLELAGGIRFAFSSARRTVLAPGERMLLVRDLMRFQERFGLEARWGGIYAGRLAMDGEELRLQKGTNLLGRVSYATRAPWPVTANHSLVLARPELGFDDPAAWRPSVLPGGSPGSHDGLAFDGLPELDLDGDGISAIAEYALGTDPLVADRWPISVRNQAGVLQVTIQRNLAADDTILNCEYSTDLTNWRPASRWRFQATALGRGEELWSAPPAAGAASFLRINVTRR